jgi:hypothetical protein
VIHFKHRSTRRMARAGRVTGTLISALANIGKTHLTEERLRHLRAELKPEHKEELRRDLPLAPAWMHRHLRYITGADPTGSACYMLQGPRGALAADPTGSACYMLGRSQTR